MPISQVKIEKILYATDFSENARFAFSYAVSLANLYEANLIILHVLMDDADLEEKMAGYVGADQLEEIKRQQLEDARQALIGKQKKKRDHTTGAEQFLRLRGGRHRRSSLCLR
ncbi:MAG: universal stress protein [Thermodesulfobacteriota bacterium]